MTSLLLLLKFHSRPHEQGRHRSGDITDLKPTWVEVLHFTCTPSSSNNRIAMGLLGDLNPFLPEILLIGSYRIHMKGF